MHDPTLDPLTPGARSHWIPLRTLVLLRWVAVAGQLAAVLVAEGIFHLQLDLAICLGAIAAAALANVIAQFAFPRAYRLSERASALMLMFDVLQLGLLLYLTGGLNNPFALLILVPVAISASALHLRSTVSLGVAAFAVATFVGLVYRPLVSSDGLDMTMPPTLLLGFWVAIIIGLAFLAIYARRVSIEIHGMSDALLATQLALVREQKLTDLGGVVAAAAHELGTPLATIKLVSTELASELEDPEQAEDARLIRDQADRCRDILQSMGRVGKEDRFVRSAPLETVIYEAAEPHLTRGVSIQFDISPDEGADSRQPTMPRQPEIIHGIRNLVQNAVDFARGIVRVEAHWNTDTVTVRISDDGNGFPPHLIGRLGDPLLRRRKSDGEQSQRPGYEGMGLGLFIAKTLLERSGARLSFRNSTDTPESHGAIVTVVWPRHRLVPEPGSKDDPLGENQPINT
ncbi:sensor histidine kinase RegB [Qingshengfaniella alkalisoli]|uniref:histidine kinase n=1 Tax=Qingshengfaniella alkalisoli TaxID=2599296 RepID=A0A5B8I7V7_9RHOB|nr:ActS/PrrB/RegB family redox-sensitive histidine kinase [Qingshengfaniella alkalisoli]QDY69965.1 ActS/PrrB/RegB family redox-sensitive histidine kinase [Qingshengfaniella alkalisoli]